ncbi:hypothetical protein IGI52_001642 [Enterococcus sp. DIV0187]
MIEVLLQSIKTENYPYLFNIYLYRNYLVGIEEDPTFLQLFEMSKYGGSSTDYFDWRLKHISFGSLLDVYGFPLKKDHKQFRKYRSHLLHAERDFKIKRRRWRNRLRK